MAVASRERWQNELAFDPLTGAPRSSAASGSDYWYNNYVQEYNKADDATRRMINDQHGFYASTPAPSGNHAPSPRANHQGGGGGGGGGNEFNSMFTDLLAQYDKLLQGFLSQSSEPNAPESEPDGGFGFEDTVLTRRVLGDDEVRKPALFAGGPQRQVMDPVTGMTYASPQAALAAGVTTWRYVPVPEAAAAAVAA